MIFLRQADAWESSCGRTEGRNTRFEQLTLTESAAIVKMGAERSTPSIYRTLGPPLLWTFRPSPEDRAPPAG